MVGDSNDETKFPHKLLLTNTPDSKFPKTVANNSSANMKLSKTQLHKIRQSGGVSGTLLGPLLKIGLPLMKNVLKLVAKSVLTPLELTTAASKSYAAIQKKISGSGMTILIISNEEMDDIMKMIKSLEDGGSLIEGVNETNQNEAKEQKGGFLDMLLGTLGASLLWDVITGKGVMRAGKGTIRAGERTIRAGQDF